MGFNVKVQKNEGDKVVKTDFAYFTDEFLQRFKDIGKATSDELRDAYVKVFKNLDLTKSPVGDCIYYYVMRHIAAELIVSSGVLEETENYTDFEYILILSEDNQFKIELVSLEMRKLLRMN